MKEILVTRIDDRLIHGQVVTAWVKTFPVTTILIVDDALAENLLLNRIYKSAAPDGINVKIEKTEDARKYLKETSGKEERIMILVKTPEVILDLLENEIPITEVILGGMGARPDRTTLNRNVSASEDEIETMKKILKKAPIYYQLVPNEKKMDLTKIIMSK